MIERTELFEQFHEPPIPEMLVDIEIRQLANPQPLQGGIEHAKAIIAAPRTIGPEQCLTAIDGEGPVARIAEQAAMLIQILNALYRWMAAKIVR